MEREHWYKDPSVVILVLFCAALFGGVLYAVVTH